MLLPGMLREKFPNLHIGYFQHIPFPSHELFRILPERVEILNGLLGADFVAFHIHDYMRHFISATKRVLHKNFNLDEVQMNDRVTRVDALPMGINYDLYHNVIADDKVHHAVEKTRLLFGDHKLIISVDQVVANSYNPNIVAPPEMKLLELSIWEDGYTMRLLSH